MVQFTQMGEREVGADLERIKSSILNILIQYLFRHPNENVLIDEIENVLNMLIES